MSLSRLPMTLALRDMLEAGSGKPVGLSRIPLDPSPLAGEEPGPAKVPYSILYSIPGTTYSGPWNDRHADASWVYQVTAVGERMDQAEWLMDRIRKVLVDRTSSGWVYALDVPGMYVMDRRHVADAGGDSDATIVSLVERFALLVTPTS